MKKRWDANHSRRGQWDFYKAENAFMETTLACIVATIVQASHICFNDPQSCFREVGAPDGGAAQAVS